MVMVNIILFWMFRVSDSRGNSRRTVLKAVGVAGLSVSGIIGSAGATSASSPSQIEATTVVDADESQPRADSAEVLERPDGVLIMLYHKMTPSERGSHDFAPAEIYRQFSHDGGQTWEDETLVVSLPAEAENLMQPSPTYLPNGDILLAVLQKLPDFETTLELYRSTDGGSTFTHDGRAWEPSGDVYRITPPSRGLHRLSSGRLVAPTYESTDPYTEPYYFGAYLSDDDGQSWRRSQTWRTLPMRGAMEPSLVERPDGTLLMSLRTQLGSVFLTSSDDQGRTWSMPQTTGHKVPESNTCLRRIPRTGDLVLFWNDQPYDPDHHHFGPRTPLSASISRDGGDTWQNTQEIFSDPGLNYSNLGCTFTSNNDAVLTWMEYPTGGHDYIDLKSAVVPQNWFYHSNGNG